MIQTKEIKCEHLVRLARSNSQTGYNIRGHITFQLNRRLHLKRHCIISRLGTRTTWERWNMVYRISIFHGNVQLSISSRFER